MIAAESVSVGPPPPAKYLGDPNASVRPAQPIRRHAAPTARRLRLDDSSNRDSRSNLAFEVIFIAAPPPTTEGKTESGHSCHPERGRRPSRRIPRSRKGVEKMSAHPTLGGPFYLLADSFAQGDRRGEASRATRIGASPNTCHPERAERVEGSPEGRVNAARSLNPLGV